MITKKIIKEKVIVFFARFFFYFFKFIGLAPMSLKLTSGVGNKSGDWKFNYSKIDILYNVFFSIMFITLEFFGITYAFYDNYRGDYGPEVILFVICDTSIACSVVIILLKFCTLQNKVVVLTSKINRVHKILESEGVNISENLTKLSHIVVISFGNIIIFIIISVLPFDYGIPMVVYNIAYDFAIFINISLMLQYSMVLKMLKNLFLLVDESFNKISGRVVLSREFLSNRSIRLIKLMESYDLLIDISHDVSKFYSLPMLLGIFNSFISVITLLLSITKRKILENNHMNKFDVTNSCNAYLNFISVLTLVINVTNAVEAVTKNH